jgi:hypothetical protein
MPNPQHTEEWYRLKHAIADACSEYQDHGEDRYAALRIMDYLIGLCVGALQQVGCPRDAALAHVQKRFCDQWDKAPVRGPDEQLFN